MAFVDGHARLEQRALEQASVAAAAVYDGLLVAEACLLFELVFEANAVAAVVVVFALAA